jgi:hypothetical protein
MMCNKDRENSLYIMIWLETISQEFERCVLEVRLLVGRREGFGAPSSHIRIAKALARRRRLLCISAPKPYTIRDARRSANKLEIVNRKAETLSLKRNYLFIYIAFITDIGQRSTTDEETGSWALALLSLLL